jgi:hypothetical protein
MNLDKNQEDHRRRRIIFDIVPSYVQSVIRADSGRDGIKILKNIKRIGETKTQGGKLVC